MFSVTDYRISFRRNKVNHNVICDICDNATDSLFTGQARRHPKDYPNKMMGKKVALTKALYDMNAGKILRTIIWKAFWEWTESWRIK